MGLYQLKDFLTFDDVADYLRDKGVYDFDLSSSYDQNRLKDWLVNMARDEKITPVFYSSSCTDVISYVYENNEPIIKCVDGGEIFAGYYSIKCDCFEFINRHGKLQADYQHNTDDDYDHILTYKYYTETTNLGVGLEFKLLICTPYKIIGKYKPKTLQDCYIHYEPFADDATVIAFNDLLYPIAQLNAIFDKSNNQPYIVELQARIAELEQQLAQQSENATPAIVELPHTNTALTALFDVINTHWQNPNQPPKQAFIQKWIVEKYPSIDPSKALWIDKIIRHQDQK